MAEVSGFKGSVSSVQREKDDTTFDKAKSPCF